MTNRHVAIVNGDSSLLLMLQDLLAGEGIAATTYKLHHSPFGQLQHDQPPVIVLDVGLGTAADGLPLLRRLKAEPATQQIPIVGTSVDAIFLVDYGRELSTHCVAVLHMPFQLDDLVATVRAVLEAEDGVAGNG